MCSCCLNCTDMCTIKCWDACFAPRPQSYADIADSLKTGDLAIFRSDIAGRFPGTNTLGSRYVHLL